MQVSDATTRLLLSMWLDRRDNPHQRSTHHG